MRGDRPGTGADHSESQLRHRLFLLCVGSGHELDVLVQDEARDPAEPELGANAMRAGLERDPAERDRRFLPAPQVEAVLRAELARPDRRPRLPRRLVHEHERALVERRAVERDAEAGEVAGGAARVA